MAAQLFSFIGGEHGVWKVLKMETVIGVGLELVERLDIVAGTIDVPGPDQRWCLKGTTSYERYVHRTELEDLRAIQAGIGRPEATCAALIPIKKSAQWWSLPQDERRTIFETQSHHIRTGIKYLPAVARRLHHGYELGEPFDFLTWFEYAPEHSEIFEAMVLELRATEEWKYVEREVDIRVMRA